MALNGRVPSTRAEGCGPTIWLAGSPGAHSADKQGLPAASLSGAQVAVPAGVTK